MRKRFLTSLALAAFATASTAWAQVEQVFPLIPLATPTAGIPFDETPQAWFIELKGAPKSKGGEAANLSAERQKFRTEAAELGVQLRERYTFDGVFNGLSAVIRLSDVNKIKQLGSVKAVYPVIDIAVPEPQTGENPDLATAIASTQVNIAQNSLGLTGSGIRVAVMDTGIDYDHPDLGGCFGPGCRVEVGYDFVGDAFNNDSSSPGFNPVPTPDAFPDDCGGHGTHVSGIVGANGVVKGAAPGVTFGAYRVFGCEGSTSADIMVAAMDRILADGADVVNISIGSSFQWPQYPTAQAADRLVENGIVVVTSAGNSGANGLYATGAPSVGRNVLSVASFDNSHLRAKGFTVSPDGRQVGYFQATGSPTAPTSGTFPLARTGTTASLADGCDPLPAGSMAGKVVLIRRGTCGFHIKALNAQNAGAAGVLIYNNVAGLQSITVVGTPAITIPVVSILATEGAVLNGRIAAGPTTMTWADLVVFVPNLTGDLISGFSSYGLNPELDVKPDLGAPGGSIYSTFPLEQGGHGLNSGTSMASPHVAGAVALLLEARPGLTPAEVRALLQNNALPKNWTGNPTLGFLDQVHRQGAGMLQIVDAVQATALVTPAKLAIGESEFGPATRTLTIRNDGATPVTYTLQHHPALSTGPNTFTVGAFTGFAGVTFSSPTVTVPAGGTATVDVTITANSGLGDRSLFGGYILLSPQTGSQELRVPYAGIKGDYQSIQALTPGGANAFPWIAKVSGGSLVKQPTGATFTLQGDDVPFLVLHLDHQVRRMEVEVRDALTGAPVHPVFYRAIEEDYLPRNSVATSFFSFAWDGTRLHSNGNKLKTKEVPDGQYVLVLKVLKALGDTNNPAHWESWTSPVVTLDRP